MKEAASNSQDPTDEIEDQAMLAVSKDLLQRLVSEADLAARDLRLASVRRPDLSPLLERGERLQSMIDALRRQIGAEALQGNNLRDRPVTSIKLPDIPARKPSL